jgi:hypothetical protein
LKAGETTLFQTAQSLLLFQRGKPVQKIMMTSAVPPLHALDVWALVGGDVPGVEPHPGLIKRPHVRVVMVSPPRPPRERSWLNQKNTLPMMYFMKTWSEKELLLVGCVLLFFLVKGSA